MDLWQKASICSRVSVAMSDLPELLTAIRLSSDDSSWWLALARWLRDNGRNDEAAAVRVYWPAMRDSLAVGPSLESVLELVGRNARRLARQAREIEERTI